MLNDDECAEFARLCRENEGVELTVDNARNMLSNLLLMLERFAVWKAEKAE